PVPVLHPDLADRLREWSERLWPGGIVRLAEAIQACRDDLEVYVSGKTALDALLCAFRRELGRPV
ncbi:MAG: hypothetical protein AAF602_04420, partial [Myxococcota bacterium]